MKAASKTKVQTDLLDEHSMQMIWIRMIAERDMDQVSQ